jgi:hypothetical protein
MEAGADYCSAMAAPEHSVVTAATQLPMAMVVMVVSVSPGLMAWLVLTGPLLVTAVPMARLVV